MVCDDMFHPGLIVCCEVEQNLKWKCKAVFFFFLKSYTADVRNIFIVQILPILCNLVSWASAPIPP